MARKGPARRPHVGIRALREQAATFVKRAQSGDAVVITVNGEPVAELGPIGKTIESPTTMPSAPDNHDAHDYAERIRERLPRRHQELRERCG